MINQKTTKEQKSNPAEEKVIQEFTEKTLKSFADRRASSQPSVEKVDGKDCEIQWRFFINHFFFIERGKWLHDESFPEYMSLVKRRNDKDDELITVNINFPDKWTVLSVDTKTWGENWNEEVDSSEEAVICSMIAYLFDQGYIVADIENDEEDLEAAEFEEIG